MLKVFLSWSGEESHAVACVFRDWLPSVLQSAKPYVSSQDIDKGARWATDIAGELEEAAFGVIVITPQNLHADWLNFEAGALSRSIDKSRVSPFLFRVKRTDVQGPLLQFQSTLHQKDEVEKLVASINKTLPEEERLDDERLKRGFSVWWPELERELSSVENRFSISEEPRPTSARSSDVESDRVSGMIEEILELVRNQTKVLSDPETILPPGYITHVLRHRVHRDDERRMKMHPVIEVTLMEIEDKIRHIVRVAGSGEVELLAREAISEIREARKRFERR
ncbi:MAG: TIR domain-containing protein [Planctomycetota bacterium]